jgi:hypothetical protein
MTAAKCSADYEQWRDKIDATGAFSLLAVGGGGILLDMFAFFWLWAEQAGTKKASPQDADKLTAALLDVVAFVEHVLSLSDEEFASTGRPSARR